MKRLFIDVETPNSRNDRICQIGAILADDHKILQEFKGVVDPESVFDTFNVELTGITPQDCMKAPTFPQIWPTLKNMLDSSEIIVGHGITFDLRVLNKCLLAYGLSYGDFTYCCTKEKAHRCITLEKYDLVTLCQAYNINLDNHHKADSDVKATMELFFLLDHDDPLPMLDYHILSFKRDCKYSTCNENFCRDLNELEGLISGIRSDGIIQPLEFETLKKWRDDHEFKRQDIGYKCCLELLDDILADGILTIDECDTILDWITLNYNSEMPNDAYSVSIWKGLLSGIAADDVIRTDELCYLKKWMANHKWLSSESALVANRINDILSDGIVTKEESDELINLFNKITSPQNDNNTGTHLAGKIIVLTGNFKHGSKRQIEEMVCAAGGIIDHTVTKKTDFLIIGDLGSRDYKHGNYGSKVAKALEYQANGCSIQIIEENKVWTD